MFEIEKQENIIPIKYSLRPFFIAIEGYKGAIKEYPIADKMFIVKSKIISFFIYL